MIRIGEYAEIPEEEIWYEFSRSQGPGGQNVNKVSSQATLCFVVEQSRALTNYQKRRIQNALGKRINREGLLRLACQSERSQARNRAEVRERFTKLLEAALKPRRQRVPTRPTRGSREKRLQQKQHRSRLKTQRRRIPQDDE